MRKVTEMNSGQFTIAAARAGGKERQQGVMLLEALVGLLIFSIGILGLVGMQAVATKNVANAQFRSEAGFLASEMMGQISVDQNNAASYATTGALCPGSPSSALQHWACRVARLPGAVTYPPIITVVPDPAGTTAKTVSVVVRWKVPDATTPSNFTLFASMSCYLSRPTFSECN